MRILGLIFTIGGLLIIAALGFRLSKLKPHESSPTVITCQQFVEQGRPHSSYIELTDFCTGDYYVYKSRTGSRVSDFQSVLILALPWGADPKKTEPDQMRLLLKFDDVRNADQLDERISRETLHGMLTDTAELDHDDRRLLRDHYAALDLRKCQILHVGRKPPTRAALLTGMAASTGMLIFGVLLLLYPTWRKRRQNAHYQQALLGASLPGADHPWP